MNGFLKNVMGEKESLNPWVDTVRLSKHLHMEAHPDLLDL